MKQQKARGYWISVSIFSALYTFSSIMDLFSVGPAHLTLDHRVPVGQRGPQRTGELAGLVVPPGGAQLDVPADCRRAEQAALCSPGSR